MNVETGDGGIETGDGRFETGGTHCIPQGRRRPAAMTLPLPSPVSRLPSLLLVDLGVMPYGEALELQRVVAKRRIAGEIDQDVLLLVEHPHVVTLGRSAKDGHLLAAPEALAARGVELFEVERGGDVTYHGPGQLVGYPIVDLKRHKQDLHWYLRQVEEALILALRTFGLEGTRSLGQTGVWVEWRRETGDGRREDFRRETGDGRREITGLPASEPSSPRLRAEPPPNAAVSPVSKLPSPVSSKIASIGVHARDWVTWHGFALNVTTDLTFFDLMVPCGIADVRLTSMERELSRRGLGSPRMDECKAAVGAAFGAVFGLVTAPHTLA